MYSTIRASQIQDQAHHSETEYNDFIIFSFFGSSLLRALEKKSCRQNSCRLSFQLSHFKGRYTSTSIAMRAGIMGNVEKKHYSSLHSVELVDDSRTDLLR